MTKTCYNILEEKRILAEKGGSERALQKHRESGKMTARERIDYLLDPESFSEIGKFVTHRCTDFGLEDKKIYGDGIISGYGKINGKPVFVYAQDPTVFGGALGEAGAKKIKALVEMAYKVRAPLIGLNDSGGARIQEGIRSMAEFTGIASTALSCSGVIPQISVMLGSSAGGTVYYAGGTDFVIMVDQVSHMFVTAPEVIKVSTGEEVTRDELGGSEVHSTKSGVAHLIALTEKKALELVGDILSYIPPNHTSLPPYLPTKDPENRSTSEICQLIPEDNKTYDMKKIIRLLVDDETFFEIHEKFAPNIIVGFARFNGHSVGIVANQPLYLSGCLDILSSQKASRFIRFCDSFHIPLVTLVDVPGFLPGVGEEHRGILTQGTKLFFAYGEATVPKISLIVKKAYGGGYGLMCSKNLKSDINFAFPNAEIAIMGPEGACGILYRKEIAASPTPDQRYKELLEEFSPLYTGVFANPYQAAESGFIDEIIQPDLARKKIIRSLEMLQNKVEFSSLKKHSTMPT